MSDAAVGRLMKGGASVLGAALLGAAIDEIASLPYVCAAVLALAMIVVKLTGSKPT